MVQLYPFNFRIPEVTGKYVDSRPVDLIGSLGSDAIRSTLNFSHGLGVCF